MGASFRLRAPGLWPHSTPEGGAPRGPPLVGVSAWKVQWGWGGRVRLERAVGVGWAWCCILAAPSAFSSLLVSSFPSTSVTWT